MTKSLAELLHQQTFTDEEAARLLALTDPDECRMLQERAYALTTELLGTNVYLRGLIEVSNVCTANCRYCGIRKNNHSVKRYTLDEETVLACALLAARAGYGSIVYLATITGLDQEMYEAARVDGATRGQCIRYLTLPLLKTTAVMLFIMSIGKIFNGDFGMIYNLVLNNTMLYRTTDVIDTYVYRMLVESSNIGQSSAVSLYQSIMGLVIVMGTNALTRNLIQILHYSDEGGSLIWQRK